MPLIRWIPHGLLVFCIMAICNLGPGAATKPSSPNILFLISDDHSGDDLGFRGENRPRTPALDRFAATGVRFTNAYAASPQCSPSRSAIVTGRSPHATGTSRLHTALTAEQETIIDVLKRQGYHTGAFRKVHLGENFQSRWQFYGDKKVPFEAFFRDRPKNQPFFLWIGFDDPHRPYEAGAIPAPHDPSRVLIPGFLPEHDAIRKDVASYYDEIARMDTEVGQVLSLLDANRLSDQTLVVFTGDNGMPFPGAKGSLYQHGVHVPLLMRWKGMIAPGQIQKTVVSLVDLAPTLLEAAGLAPLPHFEGQSLLPLLRGSADAAERPVFFERNWHDNLDLIRGIRSGNHLLIQNYRPEIAYPPTLDLAESPSWQAILQLHRQRRLSPALEKRYFAAPRPEVELYDVDADPFQLQNLAGKPEQSTIRKRLQKLLSEWMASTNDFLPPPIPPQRGTHGESIHSDVVPPQPQGVDAVMSGISNRGQTKKEAYVAAGDRAYLIGAQDGNFPDLGRHVEGEMGGLWLHPIKLVDGFWVKLTDVRTGKEYRLAEAIEFINHPHGNRFLYAPGLNNVEIERFQFCPDGQQGLIVEYSLKNRSGVQQNLNFEFVLKTDLSPVWLSEKLGIKDSTDIAEWDAKRSIFVARDGSNPWFAVWGTRHPASNRLIGNITAPQPTIGKGITAATNYNVSIEKNSTVRLTFVIAGSSRSQQEAVQSYNYLLQNNEALLETKMKRYASIVNRASIEIPDRALQEVFTWSKINLEWLVRDVPGMGRGLAAGLPEYPWWFGTDSTYALQAVIASGDFELAKQTLRLLKNESLKHNGNGRIIHEVSTNGVVYNPGNTQETAHFIMCVERLYRWSGDVEFLKEMYPVMKMGIQWLLNEMDQNKNLFPEGYGIMEVFGLNAELIDVAVYTQQALKATAYAAGILKEPDVQRRYQKISDQLAQKINDHFWDESEESYCDFFGTRTQAISAAEGAIEQIKRNHPEGLNANARRMIEFYQKLKLKFSRMTDVEKGWLTNKNWVITTPMETRIAPEERAIRLLNKIRNENTGEYGPYLSAVERQAMMTISTGVQAVSEYKYGRTEESLWYVNKIVRTFNRVLPGSITEMMPDYGDFTQAWTSYGIVLPVIEHVFGIQPDAANKSVRFEPHMPGGWENISITNLPVGANTISFSRSRTAKGVQYVVKGDETGWKYILKLPDQTNAEYYLNGNPVSYSPSGIIMTAAGNELLVVATPQ